MQAYKIIAEVEDGFLHIPMPKTFEGKTVEVIVLEKNSSETDWFFSEEKPPMQDVSPNAFQEWLLSAPVWSDEDYENFLSIRQAFNRWEL